MDTKEQRRSLRVDRWLQGELPGKPAASFLDSSSLVLASTERTARSIHAAFASARQSEGKKAWLTPAILPWESWVRARWAEQNNAGLMVLNSIQEQSVWTRVIEKSRTGQDLLHATRLATSAQHAYQLLASFAPEALTLSARSNWTGDAATFSGWLREFDTRCRHQRIVSASRLMWDLTGVLREEGDRERQPLLLVGFDRITTAQLELLNAWGSWELDSLDRGDTEAAASKGPKQFYAAPERAAEMAGCVRWLQTQLSADPQKRLMIVTPNLRERRGELERALFRELGQDGQPMWFEFSLGVPLGQISGPRSALLLLRWLHTALSETEIDWLLTCGQSTLDREEELALATSMRRIRKRGLERPAWRLSVFLDGGRLTSRGDLLAHQDHLDAETARSSRGSLPTGWVKRLRSAQDLLAEQPRQQSALDWVRFSTNVLEMIGWTGYRSASSLEFQARTRWEGVLESCGSLGFGGSELEWGEFLSALAEAVSATIFAPESTNAPVQITEPVESAGQLADAIWFLGADEDSWPGRGSPHPFLPIALQREKEMPHSNAQADWKLAEDATQRLLLSADEVVFSYSRLGRESEMRPSRLVLQRLGNPQELPIELSVASESATVSAIAFEDWSQVPFVAERLGGGAATLTLQSLCPFRAFATARLAAESWEPAETGLNAKQRGQLLHDILRRVWSPADGGIETSDQLASITDLRDFVFRIVVSILQRQFGSELSGASRSRASERGPSRFPAPFLRLEAERLTRLVTEWLSYERMRLPFRVASTEERQDVTIGGVTLQLRLDRIDTMPGGSKLIIDYKSSNVGPSAWAGDRPDDIQLPLYATFAVLDELEGLVFGRVRPGDLQFCGRLRNATRSLRSDLTGSVVRNPLDDEQLSIWRQLIEKLGEAFVAGRAEVDPKDPAKICAKCSLHSICRIKEQELVALPIEDDSLTDDDSEGEEEHG